MENSKRHRPLEHARDALAKALPEAWAIYVYGSFARGDEHPGSDIDLALLLPPKTALPDKLALMAAVSQATGHETDIVNLRETGLDLIHEVLREGRQLLVRHPDEELGWEAERMTDYALFNPRRRDILAQYLSEPPRNS